MRWCGRDRGRRRLGAAHGPDPLLRQADVVLLATRSQLPAIAAARTRAVSLRERLSDGGIGADRHGLLLVGDGRPYTAREIAKAVGPPVVASIAWDPAAADVLSVGADRPRRWEGRIRLRAQQTVGERVEHDPVVDPGTVAPSTNGLSAGLFWRGFIEPVSARSPSCRPGLAATIGTRLPHVCEAGG